MTDLTSNKDLCLRFFEAISSKNIDCLKSLMHDDFHWWILGGGDFGGSKDRETFLATVAALWNLVDGECGIAISQALSEGSRVALNGSGKMRLTNGALYENTYAWFIEIKDGRILSGKEYFDTLLVDKIFS